MCREEKERHGVVSTQRWHENVRVCVLRQEIAKRKERKRGKKRERWRGERKEEGDNQVGQAKKQEEI